jgi:hypothetical protein
VEGMSAFYLTGTYTCTQVRESTGRGGPRDTIQAWDAWQSQLILSYSEDGARELFESALRVQPEGENPLDVVIQKIVAAPVVNKLITESENLALDWAKIIEQAESGLESTPADDFEQGYWVDVDEIVRPGNLSFSLGTLQSDVPEDIRSGLNWSSDKKFFFLVNVLPPEPIPKPLSDYDPETGEPNQPDNEDGVEVGSGKLDEYGVVYPETVALVQARNSVIAAWLWRRYATNTPFATKAIKINPFNGVLGKPA